MAVQPVELTPAVEARIKQEVDARVDAALQARLQELLAPRPHPNGASPARRKRLAIVASKGTLDMAYPPLILATTAAAMDWEVGIFFTFYGLDILNRKKLPRLKVPPLGNPAMPVPVPNLLGALPGMTALATAMMQRWFTRARIPKLEQLLETARASGVQLISCTTTMGVMGVRQEELLPGVTFAGAATFLDFASEADVTLFV
ncbi:MAG: DsrE/DsrF/DrsH-like family protein [Chloroflexi bacterium]|nr:DsrE/DsrF/DrsH-like family protein [Chloroflexota bacterium]